MIVVQHPYYCHYVLLLYMIVWLCGICTYVQTEEHRSSTCAYYRQHVEDFQASDDVLRRYMTHLTSSLSSSVMSDNSTVDSAMTVFMMGVRDVEVLTAWLTCKLPTSSSSSSSSSMSVPAHNTDNSKQLPYSHHHHDHHIHLFESHYEFSIFLPLYFRSAHVVLSEQDFYIPDHVKMHVHYLGMTNYTGLILAQDFPFQRKTSDFIHFPPFLKHQKTSSTANSDSLPLPTIQLPVSTVSNVIEQINLRPIPKIDEFHHFPHSNSSYYKGFQFIPQVSYMSIDMSGMESFIIRGMKLEHEANRKMFPIFNLRLSSTAQTMSTWDHLQLIKYLHQYNYQSFLIGKKFLLPIVDNDVDIFFKDVVHSMFLDVYILVVQQNYVPSSYMKFIEKYQWKGESSSGQSFDDEAPTCAKVQKKKRIIANSASGAGLGTTHQHMKHNRNHRNSMKRKHEIQSSE